MEDSTKDDPGKRNDCDWCNIAEALGTFFVPGNGILKLCGHCRMVLMAILIDEM